LINLLQYYELLSEIKKVVWELEKNYKKKFVSLFKNN
jgi:hypothetical protein